MSGAFGGQSGGVRGYVGGGELWDDPIPQDTSIRIRIAYLFWSLREDIKEWWQWWR